MNCDEFRAILDDRLDRRLPPDSPALADHSAACPACRELQHEYAALLEAVAALRLPAPSPDLTHRVLAAARSPRPAGRFDPPVARPIRSTSRWRLRPTLTVAAAAAAMLVIALSVHHYPGPTSTPAPTAARSPSPAQSPGLSFADAGSAYWDLARRTAGSFSDARLLVSSPVALAAAVPISPDLKSPAVEWIEDLGQEIQPFAATATSAFDFLFALSPQAAQPGQPESGRPNTNEPSVPAPPSPG